MSVDDILRILNVSGVVGLLILIILGGARRLWVFGWQYRELWEDRERWKEAALKHTVLAQNSTNVAEQATQVAALAAALAQQEHKENK